MICQRFALVVVLSGVALGLIACSGPGATPSPFRDKRLPIEQRIANLLERMQPDEKLVLVRGAEALAIPENRRLGIPALNAVEGAMGISAKDSSGQPVVATAFPANVGMAATWNPELMDQVGVVIAQQAHALHRDQVLGPVTGIARSALSGQVFETYGEDPLLASRMAISYISGVQGEGAIATALFSGGAPRTRVARELDVRPMEATVSEAGVWAVKPVAGTSIRDFVNGELGFKGFTVAESPEARNSEGLDEQVRGILRALFANGILDRARTADAPKIPSVVETPAHRMIARTAAGESIVLLKNAGDILPLDKNRIRSIAVLGPNAAVNRMGGGSFTVNAHYGPAPIDALRAAFGSGVNAAAGPADAAKADAAVVFVGTGADTENEAGDRTSLNLPAGQDELVAAVARANPRTIVVITGGSAVVMDKWIGKVGAVVEAWFPGEEGSNAIADVLTGVVNPSGRLPLTFPSAMKDLPADVGGLYPGYRHFDRNAIEPLFPFGFGLSYTKFEYSNLTVTPPRVSSAQFVSIGLTVRNTGARAGKETVQLYLRATQSSVAVERPLQELRGFQQVYLNPGESKRINFTLSGRSTLYFDESRGDWAQDQAVFEVRAGSSSRDIRATGTFSVSE